MKTFVLATLGLAATTTVALAGQPLTASQMDRVTAGQASVSWTVGGSASGPTSATINSSATGTTATVGGLSPSNTATLSGTFSVSSS